MGSKKKGGGTTANVNSQMSGLDKYRVNSDQVAGMQQDMASSQWGALTPMFDTLNKAGTEQMASNPMSALMGQLFGQGQTQQPQQAPQAPQQSAYDQRLGALMQNQGMTREEAIANQAHAMKLGTDYNNDGAVGNDEWAKYKQMQQPQGMPQGAPQGMPQQQPQIGNMTPGQMAAIQKMQGYGRR